MTTVMTVDNSASMRQIVVFTLRNAGYQVIEADDGIQALNIAKNNKVDVVVTDLNIPGMDGINLIKQLRQLPSYKSTPMLMLSAETTAEKQQESKLAGATSWLVKPFNPEHLFATIKKALQLSEETTTD